MDVDEESPITDKFTDREIINMVTNQDEPDMDSNSEYVSKKEKYLVH